MFAGSRGRFCDGLIDRCRMMLRNYDAMHAGALGGADQRPEILRIFDLIEYEKARRLSLFVGDREDILKLNVLLRSHNGHDALRRRIAHQFAEFLLADLHAWHAVSLRHRLDSLDRPALDA